MRILMLTTSYPKYQGETTAPFIEEIAAGLAARGHTVHVVAPWHPELRRAPIERGVHLDFFEYAPHAALNIWGYAQSLLGDTDLKQRAVAVLPFALAGTLRALGKAINKGSADPLGSRFDLLHAHWVLPNGPPAALAARLIGLPLVISLHGSDVYMSERHWALAGAAGLTFRSAAAVTACSGDLGMRGVRLGARPATLAVIPYGINPNEFCPDPAARSLVRAELAQLRGSPLPDDAPLVLGLGRLVSKKGFGVLIDAWPAVIAHHPEALLVIAGYGDLREELAHQVRTLGLTQRVHFTGQLDRTRAAHYVAGTDLFALPIVRDRGVDGLPNALLEAMGAGRPIVASRIAGVPDVISDGVHGLLVPDRDPAALAAALLRLIEDPPLARHLGAAARQRIERELTWAQAVERFEGVYAGVVGGA